MELEVFGILESFMNEDVIIGYCRTDYLNETDIYVEAFAKGVAKKPKDYLKDSETIIVIGSQIEFSEDKYNRNIFKETYPGYGKVFSISKLIEKHLIKNGYNAKVAHNLSQKNAAVQAGLGVWGKNSLVLNTKYGTQLRLDTVVTNWIPIKYSDSLNNMNLCDNCEECIKSCPHGCLTPYKVNAKKC